MKQVRKGDIIQWCGHQCIITDTCIDADNGREIATIEPTGNYGFSIDIYLDKYGMELSKMIRIEVGFITDEAKEMMDESTFAGIIAYLRLKYHRMCYWEHDDSRHGYSLFI